jgi:2-polyprenyl-3-methyl-5-hydroxy-6-metoxy-1,4-benzoquinol methylase
MNSSSNSYSLVGKFFDLVQDEVKNSKEIYKNNTSDALKRYYHNLLNGNNFAHYIKNFYIERVFSSTNLIRKGLKILDAGCGLGTESLLFAILGGQVVGIDLAEERIRVAKERIKYYETQYKKSLEISFKIENIFNHRNKYDIIWINEAISHIDPVEKFLKLCYINLNTNGRIIIADANKFNPYIYLQSKKDQIKSGGIYKKIRLGNLEGSKEISYAIERIFTVPSIIRILSKYFIVQNVEFLRLLPFSLFNINPHSMKKLEKQILCKIPILNQLFGSYVITSLKRV